MTDQGWLLSGRLLLLAAPLLLGSCGNYYWLPGHHRGNLDAPPPVVMKAGEKRRIVSTGLERFLMYAPPILSIGTDDPEIARPDGLSGTAWLHAGKPGVTRVYYRAAGGLTPENRGFQVTVLEAGVSDRR